MGLRIFAAQFPFFKIDNFFDAHRVILIRHADPLILAITQNFAAILKLRSGGKIALQQ
jgi:hypothetical protein